MVASANNMIDILTRGQSIQDRGGRSLTESDKRLLAQDPQWPIPLPATCSLPVKDATPSTYAVLAPLMGGRAAKSADGKFNAQALKSAFHPGYALQVWDQDGYGARLTPDPVWGTFSATLSDGRRPITGYVDEQGVVNLYEPAVSSVRLLRGR